MGPGKSVHYKVVFTNQGCSLWEVSLCFGTHAWRFLNIFNQVLRICRPTCVNPCLWQQVIGGEAFQQYLATFVSYSGPMTSNPTRHFLAFNDGFNSPIAIKIPISLILSSIPLVTRISHRYREFRRIYPKLERVAFIRKVTMRLFTAL